MNNDLVEGIDFYYDDSGLIVFKEKYHLERGYCCGNGCRHCPYHFENVTDERKKNQLIQNENKPVTATVKQSLIDISIFSKKKS